jgi:hypothetical protein
MPAALEFITGQATNPGAGPVQLTANAGDSFSIRATDVSADIEMWNCWAFTNTNLLLRIRSPRMHDQSQNIRLQPPTAVPRPLFGLQPSQRLYSQDNLICEISGGAAEVDGASFLIYYNDLPGVSARLFPWSQVEPLVQNLTSVEVDPASSATAFNYGASVALNSLFDTLIRNVDYAVLGYECSTVGCSVGLRGADTGNLRLGGPLYNQTEITSSWFVNLSQANGNANTIPIVNAANVGAILCDVVAQAVSTTFKVTWNLAELKSPLGRTAT